MRSILPIKGHAAAHTKRNNKRKCLKIVSRKNQLEFSKKLLVRFKKKYGKVVLKGKMSDQKLNNLFKAVILSKLDTDKKIRRIMEYQREKDEIKNKVGCIRSIFNMFGNTLYGIFVSGPYVY